MLITALRPHRQPAPEEGQADDRCHDVAHRLADPDDDRLGDCRVARFDQAVGQPQQVQVGHGAIHIDARLGEALAQIFADMQGGVGDAAKLAFVEDRRRAIGLALDAARSACSGSSSP